MNDAIKNDENSPDDGVEPESLSQTAPVEKNSQTDGAKENHEKKDDDTASKSSEDGLKGTALLKSLLSTSTASVVPVAEKMITTTEVTDEKLNLKKILYQPDKEKDDVKETELCEQNGQQTNAIEAPADEDDRRLVIDISDEEKDGATEEKSKDRSLLLLNLAKENESKNQRRLRPTILDIGPLQVRQTPRQLFRSQNSLPQSITYNLETSAVTGITNSVKIDILASNLSEVPSSSDNNSKQNFQTSAKIVNMTALDELNVIGHEIDRQTTKKTAETLELLTELLSGALEKNTFLAKMSERTDTTLADLLAISRKLFKRHKFEVNPNLKEFMRIKHLQFPTSSKDLVIYFENLLPSLNKEKFLNMIKFYEIIVKEMLNLNKTKILQYLIDFMILRKNTQLDLLNYNFQLTSAPNLKQSNAAMAKFQLPDSTQSPSEKKPIRLNDTSYNFITRSDPIYLQAGSSFVTNHRDIITCRISTHIQTRSFERRPFDNNILKGRRIGRRLVVNSPDGERIPTEMLRNRFPLTPQSEPGTPIQNITQIQPSPPIVLVSDTPPPSLPSEPSSPPHHRIPKALILSNQLIQPPRYETVCSENNLTKSQDSQAQSEVKQGVKRSADVLEDRDASDPLTNGQISMQELQTLNQNGTEIIPTSILKNAITNRQIVVENDFDMNLSKIRKILPRGSSHEERPKPSQPMVPKMPKRRQSCHERIMMPSSKEKETHESSIEDSAIGKKYMEFLHDFERKRRQLEMQHRQTARVAPQNPIKRVRFSSEADEEIPSIHRSVQPPQIHYPMPHQITQQQDLQQQQQSQHQQQQKFIENQQRLAQYTSTALRSPVKQHHPINYKYYQSQLEHEFRIRGLDPRIDLQDSNRPLELVSNVPPERYHQHEQQRAHYASQNLQKQIRHVQEKPQKQQQPQLQQPQLLPTSQPKNMHLSMIVPHQAAMVAMTAYHQLQNLQRDPSSLTPQQYAEHLKSLDNFKQYSPSAFSAYQRNPSQMDDQRLMSEYYSNTQDIHQMGVTRTSPSTYHVSSSSSREDSPNYDLVQTEQSLQRKLKYKAKSSTYVEPNPMSKPFYNPTNSTYYTEPYALTKNKSGKLTPLTAFRTPERHRSPQSPLERGISENITSHQYQWMLAQAQAQAHSQAHVQNLAMQNQPQRPLPRPAVPAFEANVNGSSQIHSERYQEHQPTEFLRNYYANQKNY